MTFLTPTVFRAAIPLPASVPTGNYAVDVKLFADGALVARTNSALEVVKAGFEQFVAEAARDHGFLYGLVTVADGAADRLVRQRGVQARLIRQTALGGEGIEPVFAQHMRGEGERAEQIGERADAHVKPAGEGAEGRHHHARVVGGKAAAAHGAAAMRDARHRMQMAADFAGGAGRQMTEGQRAERQRFLEHAADAVGRLGIVIAGDPDPVAAALQSMQALAVGRHSRAGPPPSWKLSPSATTQARRIHARSAAPAGPASPRYHKAAATAARGVARAFFQMQVGDRQQAVLGPIQRAGGIGSRARRPRRQYRFGCFLHLPPCGGGRPRSRSGGG